MMTEIYLDSSSRVCREAAERYVRGISSAIPDLNVAADFGGDDGIEIAGKRSVTCSWALCNDLNAKDEQLQDWEIEDRQGDGHTAAMNPDERSRTTSFVRHFLPTLSAIAENPSTAQLFLRALNARGTSGEIRVAVEATEGR